MCRLASRYHQVTRAHGWRFSGGGSEAGLDASETYTLDLTGFEQHPQQGWHVKLTVNADGSQGADTKHKVFDLDATDVVDLDATDYRATELDWSRKTDPGST